MRKLPNNPCVQCVALLAAAAVLAVLKSPVAQESALTRASGAPRKSSQFPSDLPSDNPRDSFQVTMAGSKEADRPAPRPGIPVLTETIRAPNEPNGPTARSNQNFTEPPLTSRHRPHSGPVTRDIASPPAAQAPALAVPVVMEEARMPVAVAIHNWDFSELTPLEQAEIRGLQDSFADSIAAAPSQDPASPEYFKYWKSAARLHDEQLRITLGWDRYNTLSILASRNAPTAR